MKLATDFISLASKAPKGERETSQVQTKLRGIKQKLDMLENTNAKAVNAGSAPLGDLTPTEFDYAKNLASQGITRERVEAILRAKRVEH